MEVFLKERNADKLTFRQIHNRLRKLWTIAHEDDPSIGLIRAEISKLPDAVIRHIEHRAPRIVSLLSGAERLREVVMAGRKTIKVQDIQTRSWAANGGFRAWAQYAKASLLVPATSVLTAEGGRMVAGRIRGGDSRSKPHVEPVILGVTRGAEDEKPKGGRPLADPAQNLVQNLALDWLLTTGSSPKSGRSDRQDFGELVYAVFSWAANPDNSSQNAASAHAEYALRTYWERYRKAKALGEERKRSQLKR